MVILADFLEILTTGLVANGFWTLSGPRFHRSVDPVH